MRVHATAARPRFRSWLSRLRGCWPAWLLWPVVALAAIVTAQQVADAIRSSPNASAFLRAHADEIGALAIRVESGGDTEAYNGSCCYGVLQLNTANILAAGYSIARYRSASLQEQVDAWSRIQSRALSDPVIRQLESMGSFDGQPVDAPLLLACVQLGQGNCRAMVRSGSCSGFSDANGMTICRMAAVMRSAVGGGVAGNVGGGASNGGAAGGGGRHVSLGSSEAPDAAFAQASGLSMGQTAESIKLIAGGLVLLWLAWASKATWVRFAGGQAEARDMAHTMLRAAGVATLAIVLLQ